jgi:hypothetical protein
MWAVNMAISAYTAIQTGNVLGLAGGIIGGAVFGAIGKELALGMAGAMGESAFTFAGGAAMGAVEFGMGGFGAGFGASLASGASFNDSLKAGGVGAAMGAATGAIIQGSYNAGWQNKLHGASYGEMLEAQGVPREVSLYRGYSGLTPADNNLHEGIEITDNYKEYNGRWEYGPYQDNVLTKSEAGRLSPVPGGWKVRTDSFKSFNLVSNKLSHVTAAYGDINSRVNKVGFYWLPGVGIENCRTATNGVINRALAVKNE